MISVGCSAADKFMALIPVSGFARSIEGELTDEITTALAMPIDPEEFIKS